MPRNTTNYRVNKCERNLIYVNFNTGQTCLYNFNYTRPAFRPRSVLYKGDFSTELTSGKRKHFATV